MSSLPPNQLRPQYNIIDAFIFYSREKMNKNCTNDKKSKQIYTKYIKKRDSLTRLYFMLGKGVFEVILTYDNFDL